MSLSNSLVKQINQAVSVLIAGGVVAFPTETSYGLAVNPFNPIAVEKLYKIKNRDYSKPILLLVDSTEQLQRCISEIPLEYKSLIKKYWPGPLTLIFPSSENIPSILTGGTETIAIRRSPHPVANAIINALKAPITATSANLSNEKVALTANDCLTIFGDNIDYIIDYNEKGRNTFSTIVGLSENRLKIYRQGELLIPEAELQSL